jgi:LytS/YehU family sensor histidine kinase
LFISWSALYFFIKFWHEWKEQKARTDMANNLAQSAQLQMLRYQLNPHFLFNSLNSIRALIDEDKSSAKSMVTDLSEFLRYSLINKDDSPQILKNEIDAIQIYSAIQKKRYEDNLNITFDIDPLAYNFPVPNFLFHPLIENAIKYGMKTSSMPLKIYVKAKFVNEALNIEVCNSGKWVKSPEHIQVEGTGTGLVNVTRRLDRIYPNKYHIKFDEKNNWVYVIIQINKDAVIKDEKVI